MAEFRPYKVILLVACKLIKKGLGGTLTLDCGKYFDLTNIGVALDGTPITGDTFTHYYQRLALFKGLAQADETGITDHAIYMRVLKAVSNVKRLQGSIQAWNNASNRSCNAKLLAQEADAQWKKIKQEEVGAEVGAATNLNQLTTQHEYARVVQTLSGA